jgi:outer membrane biosynthesis protein TonB
MTPKVREPEPAPPEPRTDPDNFTSAPAKKKPNISLVPEIRKTDTKKAERAEAAAREQRKEAERLANLGSAFKNAGREIGANLGGPTSIREVGSYGPGGGGPTYAGYAAYVKRVYDQAWIAPDQTSLDSAVAEVRIVIARDGKVMTAEFVKRSRDRQVDDSVQRALDRVPSLRPFPEGAKEATREYILQFDLRVKRGLA